MATSAPQRDDRPKVARRQGSRPEGLTPSSRDRSTRTTWSRLVMVLNVVLIAGVAIIGLSHIRTDDDSDRAVAADPTGGPASTLADPNVVPSASAGDAPSSGPSTSQPSATAPASEPPASLSAADIPKVAVKMRSNFATGDPWPYGADFRETGDLAWPMGIVDHLMTHGPARAPNAVSWLEKWNKTDVRRIGARVLFAPNHSGSAAITAWHTSVLDTTGLQQPHTGMRLLMQPGAWQLVAIDDNGQSVITSGHYIQVGHAGTFEMVRRDSTIWLTDPDGNVTKVEDPRIGSLSGPWASWELREDKVGNRPAGFQEIWAG